MKISDTVQIAAPIDRVWDVTIDVEAWPQHTSTITSVDLLGDRPLAVGSSARLKQPAQRAKVWTVTVLEPNARFEWASSVAGQTMTARHELDRSDTGTTNTLTVELDGRLAPVLGVLIGRPIRKALAIENAGIKRAAEAS